MVNVVEPPVQIAVVPVILVGAVDKEFTVITEVPVVVQPETAVEVAV